MTSHVTQNNLDPSFPSWFLLIFQLYHHLPTSLSAPRTLTSGPISTCHCCPCLRVLALIFPNPEDFPGLCIPSPFSSIRPQFSCHFLQDIFANYLIYLMSIIAPLILFIYLFIYFLLIEFIELTLICKVIQVSSVQPNKASSAQCIICLSLPEVSFHPHVPLLRPPSLSPLPHPSGYRHTVV